MDKAWVELRSLIDEIIDVEDDLIEADRANRFLLAATVNFNIPKTSKLLPIYESLGLLFLLPLFFSFLFAFKKCIRPFLLVLLFFLLNFEVYIYQSDIFLNVTIRNHFYLLY